MKSAEFAVAIYNETDPAVLVIEDLNLGSMSVTNDIESVILRCGQQVDLEGKRVIYKDSDGVYDEVLIEAGAFRGFRSLGNTRDVLAALRAVTSKAEPNK